MLCRMGLLNMFNTGAFMVRRGPYKYVRFGTAFDAFAGYAPMLFDVEADPDELTDLAAALPATAAELDALLTLEVGDPDAIDDATLVLSGPRR